MNSFLDPGIQLIIFIQSWGAWLEAPMRLFTFLGEETFFLLILPALYWCINMDLGVRVGFALLIDAGLNDAFKLLFHGPRPYWYSPAVQPFVAEGSFGVPSGHAQNAAAVWGMIANRVKRAWAWPVALIVIFLIGLSRLYLAVHFPHDVALGWILGFAVLGLLTAHWDRIAARLATLQLRDQILIAFGASLGFIALSGLALLAWGDWSVPAAWAQNASAAFPKEEALNPASLSGAITAAATFFGLAAGLAGLKKQGNYDVAGPLWQRATRYIIGLVGLIAIYAGLKVVFPENPLVLGYLLRYVRYALVGAWVSALAPMLFVKMKLAGFRS